VQWWGWLIVAVAVLLVLLVAFLAVQARRRSGGVITVSADRKTGRASRRRR